MSLDHALAALEEARNAHTLEAARHITGDGATRQWVACRNCGEVVALNHRYWCAECEAADLKDLGHFGDEGSVA